MRIVGESVFIITREPDSRDHRDRPIPGAEIRTEIPGCVIVPEGRNVELEGTNLFAIENIVILTPRHVEVEEQAELEVRGEKWWVANPTFDHVSAFGTGRGGTEIHATREMTT